MALRPCINLETKILRKQLWCLCAFVSLAKLAFRRRRRCIARKLDSFGTGIYLVLRLTFLLICSMCISSAQHLTQFSAVQLTFKMAGASGKQLFLMIGKNRNDEMVIQLYDIERDRWYPERNIPDKHLSSKNIDSAFCLFGTKLYFTADFKVNEETETEICTYDLVSEEITYSGVKCHRTSSGKFVMINNRIYFICSFEEKLWCYDTNENKLEACADLDDYYSPRSIQTVKGLIYIIGQKLISRFEKGKIYNPETNEQTDMSQLPEYLTKHSDRERAIECTELNGKICAVNFDSLAMIFVYTPDEDVWETIFVRNNPMFEHGKLTTCNGQLVATCMNCFINIYNFDSNEWRSIRNYNGSMVVCRNGIAVPESIFKTRHNRTPRHMSSRQ